MISAYSVQDVRTAEGRAMAVVPEGFLMQRAAFGLSTVIADLLPGGVYGARVVLLVGPGSNGGDALWAGARLALRGARVDALLLTETVHAEGLAALTRAGGRTHECADLHQSALGTVRLRDEPIGRVRPRANEVGVVGEVLAGAQVVVDGILGIGGRPGLPAAAVAVLAAVPDEAVVVAVDLPSGIDPETGETPPDSAAHVWADVTVTFGVVKPGLLLPPGDRAAGQVRLVDIGLGPHLHGLTPAVQQWEPRDVAAAWPVPGPGDDKYSRGVLGVVAGGPTYTGAAVLCTGAAVATGAGMVRYVGPPEPTDLVRARWPEVVPGAGRVQAWALGPGLDPDPSTEAGAHQADAVRTALAEDRAALVDAGALGLLDERSAATLLTPHAGELARLLTERTGETVERSAVEAQPLRHARHAAELTGATVLLKGATCVLVAPDGRVQTAQDGPAWLATAGSGDVLAGIAGTLLAAGLDAMAAGAMAVVVHGLAAPVANAGGPVPAEALLRALPDTIATLLR